ncbi:PQQ-dependent sugar dehydrogenase (plasmid) [Haloferacaceae archaeon DSL9]
MSDKNLDGTAEGDEGDLRRRLLQGFGAVSVAGLAGCSGDDDDSPNDTDENETGSDGNETDSDSETDGSDTDDETDGTEGEADENGEEAATNWDNYTVTELDVHDNMMAMDIAPDGRVFYITRGAIFGEAEEGTARVNYIDPDSGETGNALELPVATFEEDGGQGITFDPDFENNGYVYLFYVPRDDVVGDDPYMSVSRFEMDENTIDEDSETEIIRIPHQREECCHVGGDLDFDSEGTLYISTGDDTNPFESDGFSPLDERDGREYFDAQRTSGNTADLRGSVLRITPEADGGYSIPGGNLFPEDEYADEIEEDLVKPEIYVMGLRNPYTIHVDTETDDLYIADYGPDADSWDSERGPVGLVEIRKVCEAQNAGWPFVRGYHYSYRRYDFEDEEAGQPYWPENPKNTSVNNTGLEDLPPVVAPDLWYPRQWDGYTDAPGWVDMPARGEPSWSESDLPEGGAPMTGPVYRHDGEGLDPYFEGKHFIMEWGTNFVKYVTYNDDGSVEINDFLPDEEFESPNSMAVGPDGRLFLQTYGPGFSGEAGKIYMIEYEA